MAGTTPHDGASDNRFSAGPTHALYKSGSGHKSQVLTAELSPMQPSKEAESSDGDPLDDLDDLLDDDLADEGGADTSERQPSQSDTPSVSDATSSRVGLSGRWFSAKSFAIVAIILAGGVFIGGSIPLIGGTLGAAGGVFLAAFVVGLLFASGKYAETGVAGAMAGAGTAVTSVLGIGFLPIGLDYLQQWGLSLLAIGGGLGLVIALLGHYFGRDLRSGITADIDG